MVTHQQHRRRRRPRHSSPLLKWKQLPRSPLILGLYDGLVWGDRQGLLQVVTREQRRSLRQREPVTNRLLLLPLQAEKS